jgi:ketosteroid isomerase-like protein
MSQENVRLVHGLVEAVAQQDLERLIELTDPEVEWHSFLAQLREGGVYRGHDGMRQYVQDLADTWEFLHTEVHDTLSVGAVVLMVGNLRYRGKGSGVEAESIVGYMLKVRRGKALLLRAFRDPEEIFEAVGLRD